MAKFKIDGISIEVTDKVVSEKIAPVLKQETYTMRGLQAAAPAAMQAVVDEIQLCRNAGVEIEKVVVGGGQAKARANPDSRRVRGRPYGR